MTIDPFTPWQEDPTVLRARTVGRDEVLAWLLSACRGFLAGAKPSWRLILGPRGSGKSHVLQCARAALGHGSVRWIGEDCAVSTDAEAFWARLVETDDGWGWEPEPRWSEPRILFVEGLDRHMAAMGATGQWAFRHRMQESGRMLVGTALSADFASGAQSAFFGQLDTWRLEGLSLEQCRALYLEVSGEVPDSTAHAITRREALIRLSGGSPRAVVALSDAVRGAEGEPIATAQAMLVAVKRLVPHYQQRFHDLSPLGQQIIEVLARAPRELTASEVQARASATSAAVSQAARSLEEAGVLVRSTDEHDARVSRYAIPEPLLRYWLEYRSVPWDRGRSAWLGRLLGEVLTRAELTDVWWSDRGEVAQAIAAAGQTSDLHVHAWDQFDRATTRQAQDTAFDRVLTIATEPLWTRIWAWQVVEVHRIDLLHRLAASSTDPLVVELAKLATSIAQTQGSRKQRFVDLVRVAARGLREPRVKRRGQPTASDSALWFVDAAVRKLLDHAEPRGQPWKLSEADQAALARVPFLRVRYAFEGRRVTHAPLLRWDRLAAVDLAADTIDLDLLLGAAHQKPDAVLFRKVAQQMEGASTSLRPCPRPELACPDPESLAPLLVAAGASDTALTWTASLADMSDAAFHAVLKAAERPPTIVADPPWHATAQEAALLALAARSTTRFERLCEVLGTRPVAITARRAWRLFAEHEQGRLVPELEFVRKAVSPK